MDLRIYTFTEIMMLDLPLLLDNSAIHPITRSLFLFVLILSYTHIHPNGEHKAVTSDYFFTPLVFRKITQTTITKRDI